MEKTLAIIKPDAVATSSIGEILKRIEGENIKILSMKMVHLDRKKTEGFYYVHKGKPFFDTLISFMTSGPVVIIVLSADDAIAKWRKLMGATNPANAVAGTIRKDFATSIEKNAVHGSDSPESAAFEISYFFPGYEIFEINKENVFNSGSK
jgi:nucleoside-diphosphate kinase